MTGCNDCAGGCNAPWRRAGQLREVPHILFFTLFSQLLRWLGKFLPVIYPILTLQLASLLLLIHFPRHFSYCAIKAATGLGEGDGHSLCAAGGNFSCIATFFNHREWQRQEWG